jgi:hypothetical protein
MVMTHEQWALTSFLSWGSLELILVIFHNFLGLGIINYGLIINYQRLIIKPQLRPWSERGRHGGAVVQTVLLTGGPTRFYFFIFS